VLGVGSFCFWILASIPAIILGIMAISQINKSHGRLGGRGMAVAGIITGSLGTFISSPLLIAALLPLIKFTRDMSGLVKSTQNITILGSAMISYNNGAHAFPPAAGGKSLSPGLSWRVAILPYIGEEQLYKEFHLDEAWDSPHNKTLLTRMPDVFALPNVEDGPGMTRYRVLVGDRAGFEPIVPGKPAPTGRKLSDLNKAPSRVIMIVEAADAVPWTKPDELIYDPKKPLPQLGKRFGGSMVVMFDGTVRPIDPKTPDQALRELIEIGVPAR
jgi:hypothetical protein